MLLRPEGPAARVVSAKIAELLAEFPEIQDLGVTAEELRREPAAIERLQVDTTVLDNVSRWAAAKSPNAFAEYVRGVKQHTIHRLLQAVLSRYRRVSIDAPVEHGKTTQVDVIRLAWEFGHNPGTMAAIVSNSTEIPYRVVSDLRRFLRDEKYRAVFPNVEIEKDTNDEIWLRRPGRQIHPTLKGVGVGGAIIGSRLSLLILDDILDFFNTYSVGEREKTYSLLNSTVFNRVLANGRIWDIGTPWHVEDARHRLRREKKSFVHVHFDATNGETFRINGAPHAIPNAKPDDTLWPEVVYDESGHAYGWPRERLAEKREEMPGVEFDRQFRCVAMSGALAVFKADVLERAVARGARYRFPADPLPGELVVTGVDLAIGRGEVGDLTVLTTITVRLLTGSWSYVPLDIRAGRWELGDLLEQFRAVVNAYPSHSGFRVENNQGQDFILQGLNDDRLLRALGWSDIEIARVGRPYAHTTSRTDKRHNVLGIRSLSLDFENDRVVLPSVDGILPYAEIQRLKDGLLSFDCSDHTSDYLMSFWLAVEHARRFVGAPGEANQVSRFGIA